MKTKAPMTFMQRIAAGVHQRQTVAGLSASANELQAWFASPKGARILKREQRVIDKALNCLFGYHLLQLSVLPDEKLYRSSRIAHCCRVDYRDCQMNSRPSQAELLGEFEALPLADESVDVTLIHHALDFSKNPHQLLNEVSRVTIAHGHVVIVGFDPVSTTGMIKPFAQLTSSSVFWKRHSLRKHRVNDWLKLLGLEQTEIYQGCCASPLFHGRHHHLLRRAQLPFGHFYCIVARKTVAGITPIKPAWDAQLLNGVKGVKIAPRPITARGAARLSLIKGEAKPKPELPSD